MKFKVWNNCLYIYKEAWKYDRNLIYTGILESITNALAPASLVVLPSFMIYLIEKRCSILQLILYCDGIFLLIALLWASASCLKERETIRFASFRVDVFHRKLANASMECDYQIYESNENHVQHQKAIGAIQNNNAGIEGMMHLTILLFTNLLGLLLYSLCIAKGNIYLVLLLFVLSALQYIVYVYARNYENASRDAQALINKKRSYLRRKAFDIKTSKDIRLYQQQDWLIEKYWQLNQQYNRQEHRNFCRYYLYDMTGIVLSVFRDGCCFAYLLYAFMQGMSVSSFVFYLGIVRGFGNWFAAIADCIAKIGRANIEVSNFRIYLKRCENKQSVKEVKSDDEAFDIVFEDVSFHYPDSDQKILDHVSFHVHPKEKIALVGLNGAGKTTLVKLLSGLYAVSSGRILINGKDLAAWNKEEYFAKCSTVFQDAISLSLTIGENVACVPPEKINREKLKHCLIKAGLMDKVQSLPDQENTYLGKDIDENGIMLSGGEMQKLYLARALYQEGRLLLLDEPTAALDAIAEDEMYQKYKELTKEMTSFFISHRLSSTRFCDRIFFLKDGKIIEEGTHEKLMAKNGEYAKMFAVQSHYYKEEHDENI